WVANIVTADLMVHAPDGGGRSAGRLPSAWRPRLVAVPGVRAVDATRTESLDYRGRRVALIVIDANAYSSRTIQTVLEGERGAFERLAHDAHCIVSGAFARAFSVRGGDVLTIASPTGAVHVPIAAVVDADRVAITVDWSLFRTRWLSDDVDAFHVMIG